MNFLLTDISAIVCVFSTWQCFLLKLTYLFDQLWVAFFFLTIYLKGITVYLKGNECSCQWPQVTGFLKGKLGMDGKDSERNNEPRQSSLIKAQILMCSFQYVTENPRTHAFVSFVCVLLLFQLNWVAKSILQQLRGWTGSSQVSGLCQEDLNVARPDAWLQCPRRFV